MQGAPPPSALGSVAPPAAGSGVVVDLGQRKVAVTLKDGEQLKAQLVQRLVEANIEDVPDRDRLLTMTRSLKVEIESDVMNVAGWGLGEMGGRLRLMHRMGPYPTMLFYAAHVERAEGGFRVEPVGRGYIRWRREQR